LDELINQDEITPTYVIAHEFFDALPVHSFVKKDDKYREVIVTAEGEELKLALATGDTAASKVFGPPEGFTQNIYEVSPESRLLMRTAAELVKKNQGGILVIDYGKWGPGDGTIRV